jgi:S1-C subfamily serine protease
MSHLPFVILLGLAQFPIVDSPDFKAKAQTAATAATVRVRDRGREVEGSGVICGNDDKGTYVLTAAHLIERIEQIEIQTFTAKSYPEPAATFTKVELLAKSDALRDLAVLRLPPSKTPLAALPLAPAGHAVAKAPFVCLVVGCSAGKPPRAHVEEVTAAQRARRDPAEEPALFWEVANKQDLGQSGGPLVDRDGFVLGICSGNNKMQSYFCHLDEMQAFLKAHHLERLFDGKGPQKRRLSEPEASATGALGRR